jgi:drug/metabolite transporter (DMT)-like permease
LNRRQGIAILMGVGALFGANHVAARLAIDHGASVAAAVATRSGCTALFLLAFLKAQGASFAMPRLTLLRALGVGALVATQSFCLYSAVARIPVALALLVFQICPMLYILLSWALGKEKPATRVFLVIPLALVGLALVLDIYGKAGDMAGRWREIGEGVLWALAAAASFTLVFFFNVHWLKALDGRLRTFIMMAVTAVLVLAGGAAAGALALPHDATGWSGLAALTLLYGTAITTLFSVLPRLAAAGDTSSTVALNFEPIAVLGIAWIVLGQAVAPLQILGAFIVVGALAWLGLARK